MAQSRIYLGSRPAAAPPTGTQAYVKVAGVWLAASVFVKVAGSWVAATPAVKVAGTWN